MVGLSFLGSLVQSLDVDLAQLQAEVAKIPARSQARGPLTEGAARLQSIVGSFSLLNAAETGHFETIAPIDGQASVGAVVRNILESEAPAITQKHVVVNQNALSNMQVAGSPELNQHVIGSVLDNAIAYSPKNSVVAIASLTKPGMQGIAIQDQGTGVSKEQLDHMLEPFTKADGQDALKMDHEGLGVSLYVSKLIMERLGGEIVVKSALGKGTTASLWWPVS